MKNRIAISVVPIYNSSTSHIVNPRTNVDTYSMRKAGGSLFNIRYIPSRNWWAEVTSGIIADHAKFNGTDTFRASRVGIDDIVISGGYRHFIGNKWQLVGYGLAGFPTKKDVDLCDRFGPLVGTRLYNLGFGFEGSYSFWSDMQRSCAAIIQQRFIHGFNRDWFPILPQGTKLQPGNITDLLFTLQCREKLTVLEGGYNITFATNQAIISPTEKITTDAFIRHSGFLNLSHLIQDGLWDKPLVLGAGFNINSSKQFDAKTITGWLQLTVVF